MKRLLLMFCILMVTTIVYAHDLSNGHISVNQLAEQKQNLKSMADQCLVTIQKDPNYKKLSVYLTYTYGTTTPNKGTINLVTPYYNMEGDTMDRARFRKCMAETFDEDVEHPERYILIDLFQ